MKHNPNRRWQMGLGITGGILALGALIGVVGWQLLVGWFQRQYYTENYAPLPLAAERLGSYPPRHRLADVPWIATRETYCQANSLAMIAAQRGLATTPGEASFLMGFTYGASEVPGTLRVSAFTDPEPGFVAAAPALGLARKYFVTDDQALYLEALRYFLAQGYPVRVAVDVAKFYGLDTPLPHSDVLIGYDEAGFEYYETVCLPEFPCLPGQQPPGTPGLWVTDETLIAAVLSQASQFGYPWRFSLTIFEPRPRDTDLGPIWRRDGQLLLGGAQYGPRQGADAIEKLAATIAEQGPRLNAAEARWGLEAAVFSRRDNAAYLQSAFRNQADVQQAADLFGQAADWYEQALNALTDGLADQAEADQIAKWLRQAAAAEREAGEIFLARG